MKIQLSNSIQVKYHPNDQVECAFISELVARLTFDNAEYIKAARLGINMRHSKLERKLVSHWRKGPNKTDGLPIVECPRGAEYIIDEIIKNHPEVKISWHLRNPEYPTLDFSFKGELRPYQIEGVQPVLDSKYKATTLIAATGTGKTCMALYIASQRKVNTLVVCPGVEIQNQWISAIEQFLGIEAEDVGTLGGKKRKQPVDPSITVGITNSVVKYGLDSYGLVILDECHKFASTRGKKILHRVPNLLLSVTATFARSDGKDDLLSSYLGKQFVIDNREQQVKDGYITPFKVQPIISSFASPINGSEDFGKLKTAVSNDFVRNHLIVDSAIEHGERTSDNITLIVGDTKKQCSLLLSLLQAKGKKAAMLTGAVNSKCRAQIIEDANRGAFVYLVATVSLIREGVDIPQITTLVNGSGVFHSNIVQLTGRCIRKLEGKKYALVVEIQDNKHGVLRNQARKRIAAYKSIGGLILPTIR